MMRMNAARVLTTNLSLYYTTVKQKKTLAPKKKVCVRRLPFYSDLLTSLGPPAARELTTPHEDDNIRLFERIRFTSDDGGRDSADWRSRTTRRAHEAPPRPLAAGEEETANGCRPRSRSRSRRSGCAGHSFEREVQTIELALRRREVQGVQRWLQLKRCSTRADRMRHFLDQE